MTAFFTHIRTRLTFWHVLITGLVVLLYTLSASLLLLHHLRTESVKYAIQDLETVEGLFYFTPARELALREDYHNHPESKEVFERMVEVLTPDGRLLYRNRLLGSRALGGVPAPDEGQGGYSPRRLTLDDGTQVQVVSRRHSIDGQPTVIRVAYSEAPLWEHFRTELMVLLTPLPFVLAVAGIGGYILAKRSLQPIQQMAQRAEQITGDQLHSRLPVNGADGELADLAKVFNGMLARLEQSFEQLRRFTSDASHELRTPLAAIRSVGEVGLQRHGSNDDYRDVIGSMLEEANRLTRLVESLLTISRADASQIALHPTVFPAMRLLEECSALVEVLLEERGQRLICEGDRTVQIEGDWLLLRQALINVVHNAIKYSPAGGEIRMSVAADSAGRVAIEVSDSGPGIPPQDLPKVFDRFYRVDSGRSRDRGGVGLGLSIAKWTVEAHQGILQAESIEGCGATFRITLEEARPKAARQADLPASAKPALADPRSR